MNTVGTLLLENDSGENPVFSDCRTATENMNQFPEKNPDVMDDLDTLSVREVEKRNKARDG